MKKLILLLIVFNFYFSTTSQNLDVIPPAPTAAGLGKYGEFPVNLYSGLPSVNIDLWNVKEGDIHIPVSLSYHPSGIRVEESASWVGLGWSLNAGGVITRSVVGLPDESPKGLLGYDAEPIPSEFLEYTDDGDFTQSHSAYLYYVSDSRIDSRPDVFNFNFNGYSGSFSLDSNGVPRITSYQKIKIEPNWVSNIWMVTTPDGVIYEFGGTYCEYNTSRSISYDKFGSSTGTSELFNGDDNNYITSWYLKAITSPTGKKITFEYTPEQYSVESSISQEVVLDWYGLEYVPGYSASSTFSLVDGFRLKSINHSNGSVEFIANTLREDLCQNVSSNRLEKIIVKNKQGSPIKNFSLNQDYFNSTDPWLYHNDTDRNYLYKRLKLNTVQEWSGDESQNHPPYVFTYDEVNLLPHLFSTSRDDRGYYNGKTNVDTNGDPTTIPDWRSPYVGVSYSGADRSPSFPEMQANSLLRIEYPTGGYSSFTYEPHGFNENISETLNFHITASALGINGNDPNICNLPYCKVDRVDFNVTNPNQNGQSLATVSLIFPNEILEQAIRGACDKPYLHLKDVTTGEIIVRAITFETLPPIAEYIAPSYANSYDNYIVYFELTSPNNWIFYNVPIDLTHEYEVKAEAYNCYEYQVDASISLDINLDTGNLTQNTGISSGLRIGTIESSSDGIKKLVKKYVYEDPDTGISSGQIRDDGSPIYVDEGTLRLPITHGDFTANNGELYSPANPGYWLNSGPRNVLGTTKGSSVGYRFVQEIYCEDSNCTNNRGRSIYKYSSSYDVGYKDYEMMGLSGISKFSYEDESMDVNTFLQNADYNSARYTIYTGLVPQTNQTIEYDVFPPKTSFDWKRGHLLSKEDQDKNGITLKKTLNEYNSVNEVNNRHLIYGLKVKRVKSIDHDPLSNLVYQTYFHPYEILSGWNYLSQTAETVYDQNGLNPVTTVTDYTYDNPEHGQATSVQTRNSEGEILITERQYAADFTASEFGSDILRDNHIHNQVLRESNKVKGITVSKKEINYDEPFGENNTPIVPVSILNYPKGTTESIQQNIQYDSNGNIIELQRELGNYTSFLWGYNSQYPVAKIENETFAKASALINQSTIDNPIDDNSLRLELQNLRDNLPNAIITTYTYDPLIGVTSITDPRGETIYYEYDDFNRLRFVKDAEGNLLNKTEYHYKNQ